MSRGDLPVQPILLAERAAQLLRVRPRRRRVMSHHGVVVLGCYEPMHQADRPLLVRPDTSHDQLAGASRAVPRPATTAPDERDRQGPAIPAHHQHQFVGAARDELVIRVIRARNLPVRAACQGATISLPVGFHALRHSYASMLVKAGVSLAIVAQDLGHSRTRMVERHYGHLAPTHVAATIREKTAQLRHSGHR